MSKETVKPYGNTVEEIKLAKDFSGALKVIELEHHEIHNWQGYRVSLLRKLVSWWSVFYQLKTWDKIIHLKERALIDWTKNTIFRFYENPTDLIDWDTSIPIFNANRNSVNTSTVNMYSNPNWLTLTDNIVDNATLLQSTYLPWTNQSAGAPTGSNIERILKPNTNYLFQAYNIDSWTPLLNADFFWYEV